MITAALAILETDAQRKELSEIYESNIKTFYSIAFSKLHNAQDAEDAIQEAFLAVAKKPEIFFGIPANKRVSYINVIIRNIACVMWNKKHKISEKTVELDDNIIDDRITVEDRVMSDVQCMRILQFIDSLPEGMKAAVHLKMNFGLKNKDIAEILGITEEAAYKRVSRALHQIKQYMEDINNE